jgi:hypothetical protein
MVTKNDINSKTSPNQMRILMKRMREGKYEINEIENNSLKKDLSMRDLLKITRNRSLNLNEEVTPAATPAADNTSTTDNAEVRDKSKNKKTVYDQAKEEEKFRNYFNDMNVDIKFIDLDVYDNLIFWGGTIDGVIQFVYKVTPDEKTTGIEFNYLPDFTADNPDNDLIIKKIESYFDTFYKYWRNNILQT